MGGTWGHLSPSNPRHTGLVKVTQPSALAAKIQLIISDNHSEVRCAASDWPVRIIPDRSLVETRAGESDPRPLIHISPLLTLT